MARFSEIGCIVDIESLLNDRLSDESSTAAVSWRSADLSGL